MIALILYLLGFGAVSNDSPTVEPVKAEIVYEGEYDVEKYLYQYNSPLASYSSDFFRASEKFGFDYQVLVAISGVESRFGTSSLCGDYNPFGYGNPCWDFGDYSEAIWQVAKTIGTSPASGYSRFRETGKIQDLAISYNGPYADEWTEKVQFFLNQLNDKHINSNSDIPR